MKCLIVILAVFALVHAKENEDQIIQRIVNVGNECIREVQLPPDQLKMITASVYPDKEATRNFVLCTYKKMGVFSPTTGFNPTFYIENCMPKVNQNQYRADLESCGAQGSGGSAPDIRAYRIQQCLSGKHVCADLLKKVLLKG